MTPPTPDKPLIVLILGGTTTVARALCHYLLGAEEELASFVRLADRFSVNPPTTYLDKPFLKVLNSPESMLEYKQVNLGNVERHLDLFTPPSQWGGAVLGEGFDVVFDLSGDIGFDRPELIQISNTYHLSLNLANSASNLPPNQKPKSYIRLTFPFYEMKSLPNSSGGYKESDGEKLKPDGNRGRWWHETIRGIGRVAAGYDGGGGLNFGVIRTGAWYGLESFEGEVIPRLVVGHVYKYLREEMKFLYNSDLRINTVHTIDISQSLYLLALHLLSTTQAQRTSELSEIPYTFSTPATSTFSLSSKRSSISDTYKTVKSVVPEKEVVRVLLFNVVDDGDSTQEKLAKAVAEVWGIKYGFLGSTVASLVQQFAKTDFSEMIDDVNEMHVEAWSEMLSASKPPIESSPISPFLQEHAFRKLAICLDGSKARRVLGYKALKPRVEVDELRRIVEGFQDDGLWPKSV